VGDYVDKLNKTSSGKCNRKPYAENQERRRVHLLHPPQVADFTHQVVDDAALLEGDIVDADSPGSSEIKSRAAQKSAPDRCISGARGRKSILTMGAFLGPVDFKFHTNEQSTT
jgi:hypothetical protein